MSDNKLMMGDYTGVSIDSKYYAISQELQDLHQQFQLEKPVVKKLPKLAKKVSSSMDIVLPKQSIKKRKEKSDNSLKTKNKPKKEKEVAQVNGDSELLDMVNKDIISKVGNVSWEDIAGLQDAKELLRETVVLPLMIPDFFKGIRRPWKGVCLYGPPGTGKTLLAKALSGEIGTTFFNVSASTLASKWRGDSEKLVRILFEEARKQAPSIVFIDEIDSLCSSRGGSSEHESSRRLKTEILVQMDGLSSDSDKFVVVIAATNFPWDLDEALRRRLEKRVYIPLPDIDTCIQLLQLSLKEVPFDPTIDFKKLANLLIGYSGADISNICRDAAMMILRRKIKGLKVDDIKSLNLTTMNDPITMQDFKDAIIKIKPSVSKEDILRYVEWTDKFGSG